MMSGSVKTDRTIGRSQSKYHGNTTGAQRRDAAIGHAKASGDEIWDLVLNQIGTRTPTRTASPAKICGDATCRSSANSGTLKPKPWMYVPSEPVGILPWLRNGRYTSANTIRANRTSRMRMRRQ